MVLGSESAKKGETFWEEGQPVQLALASGGFIIFEGILKTST